MALNRPQSAEIIYISCNSFQNVLICQLINSLQRQVAKLRILYKKKSMSEDQLHCNEPVESTSGHTILTLCNKIIISCFEQLHEEFLRTIRQSFFSVLVNDIASVPYSIIGLQ